MTIRELKKLMIDNFVYSRKHNQIIRVWAVHPGYIQCYVNGILTEASNDDVDPITQLYGEKIAAAMYNHILKLTGNEKFSCDNSRREKF